MSSVPLYKNFGRWGRRRHVIQTLVLLVFLLLPVPLPVEGLEHGLLRFDFTDWRIYFFGVVLVPGLFHLFFLAFLIPLFALAVISSLYSKIFCGWICPQNIFYEMFESVHNTFRKRYPVYRRSFHMQKTVDLGMAVFWGLIIAHTAQSYFVGAHPIFRAFCFGFVFLFFTIDTHLLKHNFCKSACPYAHLQKSFQRENSLHVSWEDRPGNKCGVCTACEQACYVDINVRETPFHLDCTMCGACIDACDRVFSRRPEPSLLQFAYNEDRSKQGIAGINSFPKAFICIAFVLFCSFFGWSVANRPRASFRIDYPASGTSEQLPVLEGGLHTNTFTVRVRSLSRKREKLTLALLDEGFEVEWVDPQDLVTTVAPFSRASARIKVRYTGEEELPPFTPIQFELTRSKSGQVIDRKELFFKPAPPCELDPLERQDVVPY